MATVAKALEKVKDIKRALVKLKEGLHSVKVSQFDALLRCSEKLRASYLTNGTRVARYEVFLLPM